MAIICAEAALFACVHNSRSSAVAFWECVSLQHLIMSPHIFAIRQLLIVWKTLCAVCIGCQFCPQLLHARLPRRDCAASCALGYDCMDAAGLDWLLSLL